MKSVSAILFASAVAAADSYGAYGESKPSSKLGYTTVHPGHGYPAVTVTAQYQPVPTYDAEKSTISEYLYVSTVIKGYNGEDVTITKTEQDVVLYSTKTTITHYPTTDAGYAAPTGYYPTGGYYPHKNGTETPAPKPYYELYEKIHEAKYKELGPKALPGYPGSGLYKGDKDKQNVKVREYKNGKWSEHYVVFDYGVPKPSATTFKNPGIYTIPAFDKTVKSKYAAPTEIKKEVPAHSTITYGGYSTSVAHPTTITATYPHAVETHGAKVKTIYKTKTVTCPNAGKYEIEKPTTTYFEHSTTISYITVTTYPAGVYHHTKETVTVTKSNSPYTCTYEKPKETYPTASSSSKHGSYPTASKDGYETYPTPSKTGPVHPDPSSDYEEPAESYGTPYAGYVKRGGVLERRKAEPEVKKAAGKRVILV